MRRTGIGTFRSRNCRRKNMSETPPTLSLRLVQKLTPVAYGTEKLCKWLSAAGMGIFMIMVALTFSDVFLRYFFHNSINGTVEMTEMLMVIVVFSSIAYTQWTKNHVVMDIVTSSLKERWRNVLTCSTTFWSCAVMIASIYSTARYAATNIAVTAILGIPYAPLIYFVSFGFITLLITLMWDFLKALSEVSREGWKDIVLTWILSIIPVIVAYHFASHRMMGVSTVFIGVIGIIVMFVLFLTGMPVAFALMATGFIFSGMLRGLPAAINMYGKAMYTSSASYSWSPLMFFMLMGYFCFYGNFGKDLYTCARRWLGHLRGGLAQGSVCACAAFGAVVGDVLSGSIAMSAIALPEMRRNNYDDTLAVGTLACSSTIGALIPPSTTFILYGVLAEQSIADLFMAGVFPGLICTFFFMLVIWVMVYRNPALAPRLPKEPLKDRLLSLKAAFPIITLFILVIGGIYGGMFTPTEGGGIGAAGTFILALLMRRLSWTDFLESLNASARFITMCFTVLAGAAALGAFMTLSRIPQLLAGAIASTGMPGWLTMCAIIVVLLVLGCFIPAMPLLLVCVPIFVPIAHVYDWNLIWFGVVIALMMNMAGITPPFGINLFVMKGLADVPLAVMFRASIPFVIALTLCILTVLFFPATATWLPAVLR